MGRGGRRYLPFVFTESGVAMLSSVLASDEAARVNISIIRTFIKLRSFLAMENSLSERVSKLELGTTKLFKVVFERLDAVEESTPPLKPSRKKIGLKDSDSRQEVRNSSIRAHHLLGVNLYLISFRESALFWSTEVLNQLQPHVARRCRRLQYKLRPTDFLLHRGADYALPAPVLEFRFAVADSLKLGIAGNVNVYPFR